MEEKTEYLSEVVARPYLRTPKAQIVKITKQVANKTEEFFNAIANGLLPQDLPQVMPFRCIVCIKWRVGLLVTPMLSCNIISSSIVSLHALQLRKKVRILHIYLASIIISN